MFGRLPKLTLGRFRAIPIRLDATFLLVLLFFLGGLTFHDLGDRWLAFATGIAGVFASILLHEVGHAATAKFYRVGVNEIVVGGFYGYATLKRQAISRGEAIRILATGPFVNLALFLALWLMLSVSSQSPFGIHDLLLQEGQPLGWARETARILALINLAMFVLNLLPVFPLDGGQILRHLLDRKLSVAASVWIVSGLGILIGTAITLYGFAEGRFLGLIGILIVWANLRRLRRLPRRA